MKFLLIPLAGLGLILAPAAHADVDTYIAVLDYAGIPYSTRTDVIHLGRAICNGFDSGITYLQMGKLLTDPPSQFTPYEAGEVIGAAVFNLCPEHTAYIKSAAGLRTKWQLA